MVDPPHAVSKWMRLLIHMIDVTAVFLVFDLQYAAILLLWSHYIVLSYPALLLALKWVLLGLLFLYYLLMETITGTSLAKMIMGTLIVDRMGRRATVYPFSSGKEAGMTRSAIPT